jgi:Raf kinase inhibitor-like YbhB/YbcL family protein
MHSSKAQLALQASLIICVAPLVWPAESPHAYSASLAAQIEGQSSATNKSGESSMSFNLESAAFKSGEDIPKKFTCEGADVSPHLKWGDPPAGTKSLALIADDPDAPVGTWVHWVMYDLEPPIKELQEGFPKSEEILGIGKQGLNDFRRLGYGGPCPPPGKAHRYYFKLYALDTKLNMKPKATKQDVERAMQGHILAQTELMGKYKR